MRRRTLLLLAALPLAVIAAMVVGRWVLHGPVDGTSLHASLSAKTNALFDGKCRPQGPPRVWRCPIADNGGSSSVDYRVVIEPDSSCWTAERRGPSVDDLPDRVHGCVGLWEWDLL